MLLALSAADTPAPSANDDIVVRAQIPPHCHPRPDDPFDHPGAVPSKGWVTLRRQRDGSVKAVQDGISFGADPLAWQRSGDHIGNYIFRVPNDDTPLCMGSRADATTGSAQLRRVIDPRAYIGRNVRFTAWLASRDARFGIWINTGGGPNGFVWTGGDGTHGWMPVSVEWGPISEKFPILAYGVTLTGAGDVWLYQPRLEVVGDNRPARTDH